MKRFVAVFLVLGAFFVAGGAFADVIINAAQNGSNVVFTISGSINTTGLNRSFSTSGNPFSIFNGMSGQYSIYNYNSSTQYGYNIIQSTPSSAFSTSPSQNADSLPPNDSNGFGIDPFSVYLPATYSSGDPLSSTMTFSGTLSSLSLIVGTYVWTLTTGDSVTLIISSPPVPTATTNAASSITATGAALNGTVSANGASTTVNFEYGLTTGYGSSQAASQSPLPSNASSASVSAAITSLTCNTLYHFRVNANNGTGGTINGSDATFTTSACAVAVPTLSEWSQLMLALMVMTALAWHFRMQQMI